MIVERLWAANELRNYHYLIACAETGEALAIDPLDWQASLALAKARGWEIRQILNTHEHHDHIGGNAGLVAATGAKVLAHKKAVAAIGGVDRGLGAGDIIKVGRLDLEVLDTPGHTMSHVCLLSHADGPALFSGDTLFNAGVGNCRGGGDVNALYETVAGQLARLPGATRIYPGHDYLMNNLRFTRHVEPANEVAADWLRRCEGVDADHMPVLTLADERRINAFFRLREGTLREGLAERAPAVKSGATEREVFVALREMRNSW